MTNDIVTKKKRSIYLIRFEKKIRKTDLILYSRMRFVIR